jgi:hypothetical protein
LRALARGIYGTESEAYLAATGVMVVSGMVDMVALPGILLADDASKAEAFVVGTALEEIA